MIEILKFVLPLFYTPKNYEDVLKRLAGFVLWEIYIVSFFLRGLPTIGDAFHSAETYPAVAAAISVVPHGDKLNIAGFVVALIVAVGTYVIQLHNRISDIFGIRRRFDRDHILLPLAKNVGVQLTDAKKQAIVAERHRLMQEVFYRFASSRADKPLVDKHYIEHALAQWSWFWVFVEASLLFAVMAFVAFCFSGISLGWVLLIIAAMLVGLATLQRLRLPRYAQPQVNTISKDHTASVSIRKIFDAV